MAVHPRFTMETRRAIVEYWCKNPNVTQEQIARKFGCNHTTVQRIINAHLRGEPGLGLSLNNRITVCAKERRRKIIETYRANPNLRVYQVAMRCEVSTALASVVLCEAGLRPRRKKKTEGNDESISE